MNNLLNRKPTMIRRIKTACKNTYRYLRFVLFPYNVLRLDKLDRGEYDTTARMEESIFHLLENFFTHEKPFHISSESRDDNDVSLTRQRALCFEAYGDDIEQFTMYSKLLDILEWYQVRKFDQDRTELNDKFMNGEIDPEELSRLEDELDNEITEKMIFVIQQRFYLWT